MSRCTVAESRRQGRDHRIVAALCLWFRSAARDLPWRCARFRTGYGALVAEAMLQQTQVARVAERYPAFMKRFPTVRALAQANEQDVLELWQGMGYYRRARNLHRAAQFVMEHFRGRVPSDVERLRQLPGVGRYTAGAIASIVFSKAVPIVDGNVERVLARLYAHDTSEDATKSWAWEKAERLVSLAQLPGAGAGAFNEAMMELGATVCTPRRPKCDACPLRSMCAGRKTGEPTRYPGVRASAKPQACVHHAVVIPRKDAVLLEQRDSRGMWAGMWQVPTVESVAALSLRALVKALPFAVSNIAHVDSFEHKTTHRAITFHIYSGRSRTRTGTWLKRNSKELQKLPMSAAQRKVLALTSGSR